MQSATSGIRGARTTCSRRPTTASAPRKWRTACFELYTPGTHNGIRANIALAETGLAYPVRKVNLTVPLPDRLADFLAATPYGRIPEIIDPDGPGGAINVRQSGAVMIYMADKQLAKTEYLSGSTCSLPDFALFPVVNQRRAWVEEGGLKNLSRWVAALAARPGVQKGLAEST